MFRRISIVVCDVSGSMDGRDASNGKSRLENAKDSISSLGKEYLKMQTVTPYIKVIPFDTNAFLDEFPIQEIDPKGFGLLETALSTISTRGSTAIYTSLGQVLDVMPRWITDLKATHVDLVLLTDGEDNSSSQDVKLKFKALEALILASKATLKCIVFHITANKRSHEAFQQALSNILPPNSEVIQTVDTSVLSASLKRTVVDVQDRCDRGLDELDELFQKLDRLSLAAAKAAGKQSVDDADDIKKTLAKLMKRDML